MVQKTNIGHKLSEKRALRDAEKSGAATLGKFSLPGSTAPQSGTYTRVDPTSGMNETANSNPHYGVTSNDPIVSPTQTGAELVAKLRQSGAIGAWKDRQDIGDSSEYARELRHQAETRTPE